ncbi:hypothetical protein BHE74_00024685, partial [Ensete ventricosum]
PSPCPPLRHRRHCPYAGGDAACRRRGQPPLRQKLLPSGGTSWAGDTALRGRCPCWQSLLLAAALASGSPSHGATPCGITAGSHHLRPGRGRCLRSQAPPLQASAMPAGGRTYWRLPLQGGFGRGRPPPTGGLGHIRLPFAAGLAVGGRPYMGVGRGWPRLLLVVLAANAEIVYPCIPDPDREDEGGQASSSLAISTRWRFATKLLQSGLATLARREGGE